MSTAPGRIIGKTSVKALRKRLSGRVAGNSIIMGQAMVPGLIQEGVLSPFSTPAAVASLRRRCVSKWIVGSP
jgi:hypothetical protein